LARNNSSSRDDISGQRVEWFSAEDATVDRSAVGSLEARYAQVDRSVLSHIATDDADVASSLVGVAFIDRGTLRETSAGIVAGRSIACDEVRTLFLASPVVRGEVHTWLDIRSALAVGVGIALGRALLSGVGALIRSEKH